MTETVTIMRDGEIVEVPAETVVVPPTLGEAQAEKLADLASIRFQRQEAGVTVGGVLIKTDPESRSTVTAAYFLAKGDPSMVRRWKVAPGVFIDIDAELMIDIGDAVLAYIQACFDRESDLTDLILDASSLTELAAIDLAAGWP